MKYFEALLERERARKQTRRASSPPPADADESERRCDTTERRPVGGGEPPNVGFVSTPPTSINLCGDAPEATRGPAGRSEAQCLPDQPYPWRAAVARWPIPWREAWGRRANQLEETRGLSWWQAENIARTEIARLKDSGQLPSQAGCDRSGAQRQGTINQKGSALYSGEHACLESKHFVS
jgi:hypothetical protein